MRATLRWALVFSMGGASACATGADPENVPTGSKSDAALVEDSAVVSDAPEKDTSVVIDSAAPPTDTGEPATDTSVADTSTPVDSSVPADTGPLDTGPLDTGTPDTGTVMMDTGTVMDTTAPMCAPSGEYGGTCVTNLDCVTKGCSYVCCAYDPFTGTIPIGCGRTAFGGSCLP